MFNRMRKMFKNVLIVSLVCVLMVGCGAGNDADKTEGQSTLDNVSDATSDSDESKNNETSKQETSSEQQTTEETTTEEPTTEPIPDDGQRDKLVAAAKKARDEYVASYEQENGYEFDTFIERAGFYDFNLDGVPEFCTLECNATGILSGWAYVYIDGKYVKQHNIYSYNNMTTYKNLEGNFRTVEQSYRYAIDTESRDITEYSVYVYDYNENGTEYIGMYTEEMETKYKVYYNCDGEKITKEQYDEILNGYLNGYTKVNNCGGKQEFMEEDVEKSLFNAYVSYLKKTKK